MTLLEHDIDDCVRFVRQVDGLDLAQVLAPALEQRSLLKPSHPLFDDTNEFVASTPNEGRDGDVIEQTSWRLAHYRRNPVVLDNHDMTRLAGRSVKLGRVETDAGLGLGSAIQWDANGAIGSEVGRQHRENMRSAVSVRWRTGKRTRRDELAEDHPAFQKTQIREGYFGPYEHSGYYLQRCELLEISSVTVPGDPGALQTRAMLDQVPDRGLGRELEARLRALAESPEALLEDPLALGIHALMVRFVRTDREMRTAIRAAGLPDLPPNPPSPWRDFFKKGGA